MGMWEKKRDLSAEEKRRLEKKAVRKATAKGEDPARAAKKAVRRGERGW